MSTMGIEKLSPYSEEMLRGCRSCWTSRPKKKERLDESSVAPEGFSSGSVMQPGSPGSCWKPLSPDSVFLHAHGPGRETHNRHRGAPFQRRDICPWQPFEHKGAGLLRRIPPPSTFFRLGRGKAAGLRRPLPGRSRSSIRFCVANNPTLSTPLEFSSVRN